MIEKRENIFVTFLIMGTVNLGRDLPMRGRVAGGLRKRLKGRSEEAVEVTV